MSQAGARIPCDDGAASGLWVRGGSGSRGGVLRCRHPASHPPPRGAPRVPDDPPGWRGSAEGAVPAAGAWGHSLSGASVLNLGGQAGGRRGGPCSWWWQLVPETPGQVASEGCLAVWSPARGSPAPQKGVYVQAGQGTGSWGVPRRAVAHRQQRAGRGLNTRVSGRPRSAARPVKAEGPGGWARGRTGARRRVGRNVSVSESTLVWPGVDER